MLGVVHCPLEEAAELLELHVSSPMKVFVLPECPPIRHINAAMQKSVELLHSREIMAVAPKTDLQTTASQGLTGRHQQDFNLARLALESHRLDRQEQVVTAAPDQIHLLAYSLDTCSHPARMC